MRLSNQYRMLYHRQAALDEAQILGIYKRYGYKGPPGEELIEFRHIHNRLYENENKRDLFAEWVVKSVSLGFGRYPEDGRRFVDAAQYYFDTYAPTQDPTLQIQKIQKFRQAVERLSQEMGKKINPRNILDFTLNNLERVEEYSSEEPVDPRVNRLETTLPEGSRMLYNDGTHQIVEVTSPEAACHFGRGSKWCTSDEDTASNYLETSPLYVVFIKGKKYGQIHLNGMDSQFMDLRNDPLEITDEIRPVLLKSGLYKFLFGQISTELEHGANPYGYLEDFNIDEFWHRWVGVKRVPELEGLILASPYLSYTYAAFTIGHRAPEFEESISRDPYMSLWYAQNVLGGRFRLGEPGIIAKGLLQAYANNLEYINPQDFKLFLKDYPDRRGLDSYRIRSSDRHIHVNGKELHQTSRYRVLPDQRIIMEYASWDKQKQEYNTVWVDEDGHIVWRGEGPSDY